MPRPYKQGLDYFPVVCNFDGKTELYIIEKGAIGLAVLITLWQLIYQNEGYYAKRDKDLFLLIKKRINVSIEEINDCIELMAERGIIDKNFYFNRRIISSKAIQKRYFEIIKKRKNIQYDPLIVLIDLEKTIVNSGKNPINDSINTAETPVNDGNNPQRKEKKSKVKNNIKRENIKREKKISALEKIKFLKPEWWTNEEWQELIDHRKNMKATQSERSYKSLMQEFEVAKIHGMTAQDILDAMSWGKGWAGFKWEWVENRRQNGNFKEHVSGFIAKTSGKVWLS